MFYGIHTSPFGLCLVVCDEEAIQSIQFIEKNTPKEINKIFSKFWPKKEIKENNIHTASFVKNIFIPATKIKKNLSVKGTQFQMKVWNALQKIPFGQTKTYTEIALAIGSPKAVRAVGTACAANTLAYIVPCHRVVPSSGGIGQYRWGIDRKKAMIEWEKQHLVS